MATKKIDIPGKTIGYGYAGVWADGRVGWFSPEHVSSGGRKYNAPANERAKEFIERGKTDRFFLCKITMTPVLDKNGRPITRKVKSKHS